MLETLLSNLGNLVEVLVQSKNREADIKRESIERFFLPFRNSLIDWVIYVEDVDYEYTPDDEENNFDEFFSLFEIIQNSLLPLIEDYAYTINDVEVRKKFFEYSYQIKRFALEAKRKDELLPSIAGDLYESFKEEMLELFYIVDEMVKETRF